MPDQALAITPEVLQQLGSLLSERKFEGEGLYPGAPDEDIRHRAEGAVNTMLGRLQVGLLPSPYKSYVLSEFLEMLKSFENDDTEEREQACSYCERVMDLLGIESSDGMLNTWLYGFDPGQRR
jgi:hypothetical protein